ncbi:hypothetical protein LPH50_11650 [Xylella taiwanensis]|uniref:Uncharacterized protein n=1 Tax=Xylella taiwanensis TaxID=1444770 RepID=Z9JJR4_9GAMM|nr:hypothetical protein [Xylella taiwanensis]EWS78051.1 hypothetical protein AF72_07770 [Xylella taiwanensis]MCD8456578.1 hypothetical protein [Xylella taiwanensis]MCD8458985.1 hypothetical protein [Xylella taiwanensis]MCD8461124.1 hypothetical protein [Xylella taiwanensis]MCD8462817.1 hypothetical protein [Xylella taiwanensis]
MSKNRTNRLGFAHPADLLPRVRPFSQRQKRSVEAHGIAVFSKQLDVPAPIDSEAFLPAAVKQR